MCAVKHAISAQRFSRIVGAIYDCALAPSQWQGALLEICDELSFLHALLSAYRLPRGVRTANLTVAARLSHNWLDRMADYGSDMLSYWGGYDRVQSFPIDEPTASSRVVDKRNVLSNRFRREWMEPQGIVDLIGLPHARTPSLLGSVVFARHESVGVAMDAELVSLRLIAPHIRRAIEISNLLDMKTIEAENYATAFDALSVGVILVDDAATVLHANEQASRILSKGRPLYVERGVLKLTTGPASRALADAVAHSAREEATLAHHGIGVPASDLDGNPYVAHVLPLRRGEVRSRVYPRAAAAIFVAPAAVPPKMPSAALALIFDLTPAETRVFECLAEGSSPDEIGVRLGVSVSTVKTHMKQLYAKVGVKRRVELIRLAASLSLTI